MSPLEIPMNKELIAISHELGHGGDLYTTPLDALRGPSQQQLEFLPDIIEEYERRHPVDAGETSACSCYGHAPRILPYTARIYNLTVVACLDESGRSLKVVGPAEKNHKMCFKGLVITRDMAARGLGTAYFDRVFWMLKSA
jgi:hypothetical protein